MSYQEFSTFLTGTLTIEFTCINCNKNIVSDEFVPPIPNIFADKSSNSNIENEEFICCEYCGRDYEVSIIAGTSGGTVEIMDIDDFVVHEHYSISEFDNDYFDAVIASEPYSNFQAEMENIKALIAINEICSDNIRTTLYRYLYSACITCLEDYLSSTIIQKIMSNEVYFKNFVKGYKDFSKEKFTINEIYKKLDDLNNIVKNKLSNIIYHNLAKVQPIYEKTFKIPFPNISELSKAVKKRHHMVHRNGKDTDGNTVEINLSDVQILITNVNNFVTEIENSFNTENSN